MYSTVLLSYNTTASVSHVNDIAIHGFYKLLTFSDIIFSPTHIQVKHIFNYSLVCLIIPHLLILETSLLFSLSMLSFH